MPIIQQKISKGETKICFLIFAVVFLSRIIFSEKHFFDGDTVGIALGSISYSLQNTRPHLPGYFLHVQIISLLNYFINDIHLTMILLSSVYSSFGAVFCYILLKKWFTRNTSLLISSLIMFNPLVWFQGSTPEVYSFDLLFSALFVLLILDKKTIYLTPLLLSLGSGIRQTSGLLLLPLYIYFWYQKINARDIAWTKFILAHLLSLLIFLCWFIPMVNSAGGLVEYLALYKSNSPLPNITLAQNIFQFSSYCFFVFTPLILLLLTLIRKRRRSIELTHYDKNLILLLSLWLIPPLITFILFIYNKGYFLIVIIPLYALPGILIERDLVKRTGVLVIIIIEILFFLLMPYKDISLQSIINPDNRTKNFVETWIDRTFSSYLMTASRIKFQDQWIEKLSALVSKHNAKVVFLDPTTYSAARGLQLKYPEITFIAMDYNQPNSYIKYKGLDVNVENGMYEILESSLLITRKDFYENYLKIFGDNVLKSVDFVALTITESSKSSIFSLYQKLFLR